MPVSNRCPLTTENLPPSDMSGGGNVERGPDDNFDILRDLRLRYANSSAPVTASSISPPRAPTRAGTRGTTLSADGAPVAVWDDVGPPMVVGLAVGGKKPNVVGTPDVAEADVSLNEDPLDVAEILPDEPLNEFTNDDELLVNVEFRNGADVADGIKEVRLAERLVTMLAPEEVEDRD